MGFIFGSWRAFTQKFENIFINNLHKNTKKGIILSCTIKGQGGMGHFNEQNNDYIKLKICNLGYTNDLVLEKKLRNKSTLKWFKNTIMVFRKNYFNTCENDYK